MRFLETLEFASRIFSASGSFALKLMQERSLNTQLQKAQKKSVDGLSGGPYKPPLPDGPTGF